MLLRTGLHALGWRYRLHGRSIPGRPDLVFRSRGALIFANGCFWHGHDCHLFRWPKSRPQFWQDKIASNIARDLRVREALLADGWRIAEVWECTLKGRERRPIEEVLAACDAFLRSEEAMLSVGTDLRVAVPAEGRSDTAPA
jgi:DNA mismatch endonuclease (patch repair protein)